MQERAKPAAMPLIILGEIRGSQAVVERSEPLRGPARLRIGRPLAVDDWIRAQEDALDRLLAPRKPGPKLKTAS